jgi:sterol 3beta-glucosyltransferase
MAGLGYEKERQANVTSYSMFETLQWTSFSTDINLWRRRQLRLPAVNIGSGVSTSVVKCKISFSAMWSPSFVPKPPDWPEQCRVVGTFTQDKKKASVVDEDLFADLIDWLKSGDAPIFIGFGSMVIKDTIRLERLIMAAAQESNTRIVVQSSWSKLDVSEEPLCHNVGPCPHDWLLPMCAGIVHHGKIRNCAIDLFELFTVYGA